MHGQRAFQRQGFQGLLRWYHGHRGKAEGQKKDLEEPAQVKPSWPIFVVYGAPRALPVAAEGEQELRKRH